MFVALQSSSEALNTQQPLNSDASVAAGPISMLRVKQSSLTPKQVEKDVQAVTYCQKAARSGPKLVPFLFAAFKSTCCPFQCVGKFFE